MAISDWPRFIPYFGAPPKMMAAPNLLRMEAFLFFFALFGLGSTQLECPSDPLNYLPFRLNGTFTAKQDCLITILLNGDGTYPLVDLRASNIASGDTISLRATEGVLQPAAGESEFSLKTALLPAKVLTLQIKTESSSSLTVDISINSANVTLIEKLTNISVNPSDQAVSQTLGSLSQGTYVFSSENSSKLAFSLISYPSPGESTFSMNYFIYENEIIKGSLYQFRDKVYVSESGDVKIFVALEQPASKSLLLTQSADNLSKFSSFATSWAYGKDENGTALPLEFHLSANYSSPAVLIVAGNEDGCYLTDVNVTDSSVSLSVYPGTKVDDEFLLSRYSYFNVKNALPQQLPGFFRTFALFGSSAKIRLVPNVEDTKWQDAYIGREGFLMTKNYPFLDGMTYSMSMTLKRGNGSEEMYFRVDSPLKGDNKTSWLIRSDGVSSLSGSFNDTGAVRGTTNFTLSIFPPSGDHTGALISWKITDVPTTTTMTTPTSNSSAAAGNTTTTEIPATTTPLFPDEDIFLDCNETNFDLADGEIQGVYTLKQSCNYTFVIPSGFAAAISLSVDRLAQGESVILRNDYQDVLSSSNGGLKADVTWIGDDFHIDAVIGNDSTNLAALTVKKVEIKKDTNPKVYNITSDGPLILDQISNFLPLSTTVIRAASQIHLSVAKPGDHSSALNLFVYEGEGANSSLKGSLYNVVAAGNPWISTPNGTNTITIYNAANETFPNNFAKYLINEVAVMEQYRTFSSNYSPDLAEKDAFIWILDATNGSAAMTFIDDPADHRKVVIKSLGFENVSSSQVLKIYSSLPRRSSMDSFLTLSYSNTTNMASYLPQDLSTYVKTFVLNSGIVKGIISSSLPGGDLTWTQSVTEKMAGRIITPNYRNLQGNSTVPYRVVLKGDGPVYNFYIRVLAADSTCTMTYTTANKNMDSTERKNATLQDQIIVGNSLELQIFPGNSSSSGAMLSYSVYETPTTQSAFLAAFSSLFLLLLAF